MRLPAIVRVQRSDGVALKQQVLCLRLPAMPVAAVAVSVVIIAAWIRQEISMLQDLFVLLLNEMHA